MKTIIAGSRDITDYDALIVAVNESGFTITEVVSGGARGADTLGERWAAENGVPVHKKKPDWKKYGKAAGPIRNEEMGDYADALIALWDGESRGTKHMIEYSQKKGLQVHVRIVS